MHTVFICTAFAENEQLNFSFCTEVLQSDQFAVPVAPLDENLAGFSHDTEIQISDILSKIGNDQLFLQSLRRMHPQAKISLNQAKNHFGLSEKQIRAFALRKGASSSPGPFHIADFNKGYMAPFFDPDLKLDRASRPNPLPTASVRDGVRLTLLSSARMLFKKLGIPHFNIGFDPLGPLEIRTTTFHTSIEDLKKEVESIHLHFPGASTQLHLGLPGNNASTESAVTIARTLETNVVLSLLAREESELAQLPLLHWGNPYTKSPLSTSYEKFYESHTRNVVRLVFFRFGGNLKPEERWHDIEIRQYESLEHGFALLELAYELYKERNQLLTLNFNSLPAGFVPEAGNAKAAIIYLLWILSLGHIDLDIGVIYDSKIIHKELERLKVEERMTPQIQRFTNLRVKVREFLLRYNLLDKLLKPKSYLQPEKIDEFKGLDDFD